MFSVTIFNDALTLQACWVNFSADDILKYFSHFFQETGFDLLSKLSPVEWNVKAYFPGKIRIINLSSAEFAHRVVNIKG